MSGLKFVSSYSYFTNLATDGPFVAFTKANLHANIGKFSWTTFSAEYSWKNWLFASEWQRTDGQLAYSAPPVLPSTGGPVGWDGWYVSASRRLGSKFEAGTSYGFLKSRFPSSAGSDPRNYQKDVTVSLRYDLSEHVLFKLEWHNLDGTYQTFNTARIPNPTATRKNSTTIIAAKTTLSF